MHFEMTDRWFLGGRYGVTVMTDMEGVFRGADWDQDKQVYMYWVRILYLRDRSLYSIRSLMLSIVWENLGAFTITVNKKSQLLKESLTLMQSNGCHFIAHFPILWHISHCEGENVKVRVGLKTLSLCQKYWKLVSVVVWKCNSGRNSWKHSEDNVLTGEIVISRSRRAKQRNTVEMSLFGCRQILLQNITIWYSISHTPSN